jgi:3',5'-cyclic-AMP phosphodiesterase
MPMKKLLWLTDLHLNLVEPDDFNYFINRINDKKAEGILISGDVCDGSDFGVWLEKIQEETSIPLFFILGNHDYYGTSIASTRKLANHLGFRCHYLTSRDFIDLSDDIALVGHDGWADGRYGDFLNSSIVLRDYEEIDDLKDLSAEEQLERLAELGDEASMHLKNNLEKAFKEYRKAIVLIHPPPFPEACLYNNSVPDSEWGPHFICQAAGETLLAVMNKHPDKEAIVLCGHAHNLSDVQILPNLRVLTGGYEKGRPLIQKTLIL